MIDVWLYSCLSVITISICGLVPIICMPRLQKTKYQNDLMQFLIGLAIGTLTADALLHLLPISGGTITNCDNCPINNNTSINNININNSLTHHHHELNDNNENHSNQHHDEHNQQHQHTGEGFWFGMMALIGIIGFLILERFMVLLTDICTHNGHVQTSTSEDEPKERPVNDQVTNNQDPPLHVHIHHSHQHETHQHHQHHHLNSKTQSFMFMIITGDGLHNFFDGIAIGVSYNSGLAVGLSTSIAILCHELPHEIGDFAVLIKNGMSIRRAVLYNTLSSVLCLLGALTGVFIGRIDVGWVSALIAGMFLYISLVDMVPQLSCYPGQPALVRVQKLVVQILGILAGVAIMSFIALYENRLHSLIKTYSNRH